MSVPWQVTVPTLPPLEDPETGELERRRCEAGLPQKRIRAWNLR